MRNLFLPVLFILAAGLVTISSISQKLFLMQSIWALGGVALVVLFASLDLRGVLQYRWLVTGFYLLAIILLILAYLTAPVVRNTRSWIYLGSFSFQPVELAKIALILAYARFFSRKHLAIARWPIILSSFFLFALPGALTLLQPDLGSASILFGIWFGFLLVSGLPLHRLLATLLVFVVVGAFGWAYFLKDYQKQRIVSVFYPEKNALTVNYSTIQSKIAIGSAGLWGKGYKQGPQTQLGFLTEPANDFVLAALIEEWGLVIGTLVIAAFAFLIYQILKIGMRAAQNFEKFICLGVAMVFGLHFMINTGSTLGLFPVVGVTFPFLSYGGSSLIVDFSLLAMVSSISRRNK